MAKKRIALIMQELVFPDGKFIYSGGDRYTRDLARLIRDDMGMDVTIFQKSTQNKKVKRVKDGQEVEVPVFSNGAPVTEFFETTWDGFPVVGLPSANSAALNMDVAQNSQEYDAFVYFHIALAHPRVHRRSVSISHGIWFDHVKMAASSENEWVQWRDFIGQAIGNVDRVISVDTNSINFFNGLFYGRYAHKFDHIPNAVDTSLFKPGSRHKRPLTVLFPRRWEVLRGSAEMMRVIDALRPKYQQVTWKLCGAVHDETSEKTLSDYCTRHPDTIWEHKTFDEMPAVYQSADIAVIPTIGAEGTSYSLLESLSSGIPVVSTHVGGLSELVIDGFNGIKVAPRYEEIRDAVDYLIRNPAERERMGRNARLIGERFSSVRWKKSWSEVITDLVR